MLLSFLSAFSKAFTAVLSRSHCKTPYRPSLASSKVLYGWTTSSIAPSTEVTDLTCLFWPAGTGWRPALHFCLQGLAGALLSLGEDLRLSQLLLAEMNMRYKSA